MDCTAEVIGDVCAFRKDSLHKRIGRVLQFAYNDKKAQNQHKGNYAIVSGKYGVLCTWYSLDEGTGHCQLITSEHEYIPTNNYICTLTSGCIIKEEKEEDSQLHVGFVSTALSLSKEFYIDKQCLNSILSSELHIPLQSHLLDEDKSRTSKRWIQINKLLLTEKEKTIIASGKKLTDVIIDAAQLLIKMKFPNVNGRTSLFQQKYPLTSFENIIQIILIDDNHWAVISTHGISITPPDSIEYSINYYDSIYSNLRESAEDVIAYLISQLNIHELKVNCAPTPEQSGGSDCGLYSIAIATAIAHDLDPANLIFEQSEMRPHLVQCLSSKELTPFPVMKSRRLRTISNSKQVTIYLCPICKKCGDGRDIVETVQCERCNFWFHERCVPPFDNSGMYLCPLCSTND